MYYESISTEILLRAHALSRVSQIGVVPFLKLKPMRGSGRLKIADHL